MPANIQVEVWRNGSRIVGPVVNTSVEDLRSADEVRLACPDDNQSSYLWDLSYTPLGAHGDPVDDVSGAVLDTPNAQSCKFTVDWDGPYLVRLVINRGDPVTEDTKFIRARVGTKFGGVKLVAAGERRTSAPYVPDDASTVGWANDLNTNMQKILAGIRRLSVSGRILYVDPNRPLGYKDDLVTNPPNDPTKTIQFPGTDSTDADTMAITGVEVPALGFGDFGTIQDAIDWAYGAGRSSPTKWARPTEEIASALNPFWIVIQPGLYNENLTFREHIHLAAGGPPQKANITPLFSLLVGGDLNASVLRTTSVIIRPVVDGSYHGGHVFNAPQLPEFNPSGGFPQPILDFLANCPLVSLVGISLEVFEHCIDPMITITGTGFLFLNGAILANGSVEGTQGPSLKFLNPPMGTATLPLIQFDFTGLICQDSFIGYAPQISGTPVVERSAILVDSRLTGLVMNSTLSSSGVPCFLAASDMYTASIIGPKAGMSSLGILNTTGQCSPVVSGLFQGVESLGSSYGDESDQFFIDLDTGSVATVSTFSPHVSVTGGLLSKIRVNGDKITGARKATLVLSIASGPDFTSPVFDFVGDLTKITLDTRNMPGMSVGYDASHTRPEGTTGVIPSNQQWPHPKGAENTTRLQDFLDASVRLMTPEVPNADGTQVPALPALNASGLTATYTPTLNAGYAGIWGFDVSDGSTGLEPVQGRGLGRHIYIVRNQAGADLPVQLLPHPSLPFTPPAIPADVHLLRLGAGTGIDLGYTTNEVDGPALKVWGDIVADNISITGQYEKQIQYYNIPTGPLTTDPGGENWPWDGNPVTLPLAPIPSRQIIFGVGYNSFGMTINLPRQAQIVPNKSAVWPVDGQIITVKDETGLAGGGNAINIRVSAAGTGGLIDGATWSTISTAYGSKTFYACYTGGSVNWYSI